MTVKEAYEQDRRSSNDGHLAERVEGLVWENIARELDSVGFSVIRRLLPPGDCRNIAMLYPRAEVFRSHIHMARHGFGQGEYKYFRYPLPDMVGELRATIYPHLVPIANRWYDQMRLPVRFPQTHSEFIARCQAGGQTRPTPLLVQYEAGDYNCLHQDLYGDHVFPLQMAVLLAEPGRDFTGGELILTEQRPRMQSRAEVIPLGQGDAVVFAVRYRPVAGTRGTYRVNMRHGVSRIHSGLRHTLGLIFHDAT